MKVSYENGEVLIRIKCTEEEIKAATLSKSGKTKMIATTSGFTLVEGAPAGVKLSLNLVGPKGE